MCNIVIKLIKAGKIGVLPTDTIYGLVGSALSKSAVSRIYKIKKRNPQKPLIILIGSMADLKLLGVKLDIKMQKMLRKIWPGPISVILSANIKKFSYLHRGKNNLAFRLPKNKKLRQFLKKTGPIVAPSANPENKKPAESIIQAKEYFGENIDFYVDDGTKKSKPSTLVEIKNGKIVILRKGATDIK